MIFCDVPCHSRGAGGLSSPLHTLQNQVVGGNRRSVTLKSVFGGSGLRYVIDDCPLRYNEAIPPAFTTTPRPGTGKQRKNKEARF